MRFNCVRYMKLNMLTSLYYVIVLMLQGINLGTNTNNFVGVVY
jgi:hypothetical protein